MVVVHEAASVGGFGSWPGGGGEAGQPYGGGCCCGSPGSEGAVYVVYY